MVLRSQSQLSITSAVFCHTTPSRAHRRQILSCILRSAGKQLYLSWRMDILAKIRIQFHPEFCSTVLQLFRMDWIYPPPSKSIRIFCGAEGSFFFLTSSFFLSSYCLNPIAIIKKIRMWLICLLPALRSYIQHLRSGQLYKGSHLRLWSAAQAWWDDTSEGWATILLAYSIVEYSS